MKILTVYLIDSFLFYHLYSFSLHRREVLNDSYMKTNNLFMFCTCTSAEEIFLCAITYFVISVVMGFKWNMNYWQWACGWGVCNHHSLIESQEVTGLYLCDFDSMLPKRDEKHETEVASVTEVKYGEGAIFAIIFLANVKNIKLLSFPHHMHKCTHLLVGTKATVGI